MGYGELAALAAACMWAIASVLFRMAGTQVSPWALNLYKGLLACAGFIAIISWTGDNVFALPSYAIALLLLSGLIGIGVGDTAFFIALNRLGERQAVLLAETLAPGIAYVLGFVFLGEVLKLGALGGVCLTVAGVGIAIAPNRIPAPRIAARQVGLASENAWYRNQGIWMAVVAAACQAIGVVMTRSAFAESDASAAESGLLRLSGGLAIIVTVLGGKSFARLLHSSKNGLSKNRPSKNGPSKNGPSKNGPAENRLNGMRSDEKPSSDRGETSSPTREGSEAREIGPDAARMKTFGLILLATILGTWIGIYLQQTSLLYTNAVITQTLISTSVLFVIPIAWLLGDSIQWRSVLGAGIAFGGVALIVGS